MLKFAMMDEDGNIIQENQRRYEIRLQANSLWQLLLSFLLYVIENLATEHRRNRNTSTRRN